MEFNTFYNKIQTDESMMETIQHGNSEYPFQLYYDDLALFDFHCVEWHWHVEFEFVFVQEGTATFWVGEKQFSLGQGTGIFINSKILHRYFSEGHAIMPNFVLKPTFLAPADSLIYKKYIAPIQACKVDCIVFCREIKWQAEALELMQKILKAQESDKDRELVTLFLTQELWHLLYLHMDSEVPQKGVLFSGTIASNLRFGKDDATDAEIEKAAAIAQATEFIEAKDDKYETAIAQGGTNVSGGQKQRLAIARAIAKDPKIFIFDDSFSALDLKTDAALRKALAENVKDSTVIIVAQRISTILHAEQILVLDDGKVVGKGTHEELLRSCEVYQEIAKSQLSEKELGLKESEVADHE